MQKQRRKPVDIVVLASSRPDLPKDLSVAAHECGECGTTFSVTATLVPYCVKCGSEDTNPIQANKVETSTYTGKESISAIKCECGTFTLIRDEDAIEMAGSMGCVACGATIDYSVASLQLASDECDAEAEDESEEEFDVLPDFDDEPEDADLDLDLDLEESNCESEPELESEEEIENFDDFTEESDVDSDEEFTGDALSDALELEGDMVEASLMDLAKGETSWVKASDRVMAFVGDICVATLVKSPTIASHKAFDRPAFMEAIVSHYNTHGMAKTLQEFSFKTHTIELEESSVMKGKIEGVIALNRAELDQAVASWTETYNQSLQIAAAGLNKQFFSGKRHELKASLYSEMKAAGVRNPSSIIDRVFASSSDAHHQSLFDLAHELAAKPEDTRNSLAEAIGCANYIQASAIDEQESEDQDTDYTNDYESVESSLEKPMRITEVSSTKIARGRLFSLT